MDVDPGTATGPVIRADVDEEQHAELGARVLTGGPEEATYATAPMLVSRDETGLVFFPDQLETWLGLTLATEGHAVGIVFPEIAPDSAPALTTSARGVTDADFFSSATEDRYPDVFGLLPPETSTKDLVGRLTRLPHQALTMNHDPVASTAVLLEATRSIPIDGTAADL